MQEDLIVFPMLFSFLAWIVWFVLTTIRRYKVAKLQAEVSNRLIDKFGSSQELFAELCANRGREGAHRVFDWRADNALWTHPRCAAGWDSPDAAGLCTLVFVLDRRRARLSGVRRCDSGVGNRIRGSSGCFLFFFEICGFVEWGKPPSLIQVRRV